MPDLQSAVSNRKETTMRNCALTILAVLVVAIPLAAQTRPAAKPWAPAKTPWGDPDLQGTYTSDDCIGAPMNRPANLGDKLYYTEQELAQAESRIARQAEADKQEFVAANAVVTVNPPGHWGERARRPCKQTSLVIDPPDGRTPPLTPEAQARGGRGQRGGGGDALAAAPAAPAPPAAGAAPGGRGARGGGGGANNNPANQPASWEDFSFYIRCITRGVAGSILPVIYGNGTQILQAKGYVTLLQEMVHEARVIPLDGRPHANSNIRSYMGDSRGHWEGNTLVVETTNFLPNKTGIGLNGGGTPTSDALKLTERFTKTDPTTISYEMTIDDPKTYTKPWKVAFPITQENGYSNFEYACHEGNYAMFDSLSGARAIEKAAAEAAKTK
jgi:hypothetical protein